MTPVTVPTWLNLLKYLSFCGIIKTDQSIHGEVPCSYEAYCVLPVFFWRPAK